MIRNRAVLLSLGLVFLVSLSACGPKKPVKPMIWVKPPHPEGLALSEQDQYTPLSKVQAKRLKAMRAAGVFVLRQGDYLKIILPVDAFFLSPKPVIRRAIRPVLSAMADFLREYRSAYPAPVVRVTGYADEALSQKERQALSTQYAKVIASYLWRAGIKAKQLHVKGEGSRHPLAIGGKPADAQLNRRVEIEIN